MKISFIFGLLLALFSVAVNGFRFYSPYDVFKSRQTRWSNRDANTNNEADDILYPPDSNADYYKIISYLNDVGKRRR